MTRTLPVRILAPAALLSALALPATAQCEVQKYVGSGVHQNDQFANALAVDGLTVITGCNMCDDAGGEAGTVFVHDYDGYGFVERTPLTASDGAPFDHLGWSVALEADLGAVIAGAPDEDRPLLGLGSNPGAAYLFLDQGGSFAEVKVTANDATNDDRFGFSTAVSGRIFVVGAPDKGGVGAAYVFFYPGASAVQVQRIDPPDPTSGMQFGYAVAWDGVTMAIGARRWDAPGAGGAGKVYLYTYDGAQMALQDTVVSFDAQNGDNFGSSVTIEGGHMLVGAPNDDDQGFGSNSNTGVVFYFQRNGQNWNFIEKVLPPATSHGFGNALSIDGDRLLVGAFLDKEIGQDGGAAHVFDRSGNTWTHRYKILASDHVPFSEFGGNVALDGDVALVSSKFDDDVGHNSGAAYGFSVDELFCQPLYAWPGEISLSNGGRQDWTVDVGPVYGGFIYWVLGGLAPGSFQWDNAEWPLTIDEYFFLTAENRNTPTFPTSLGFLDGAGGATSALVVSPGIDPSLAGITLYHATAVFDPNTITVEEATNPTSVLLVP